MNVTDVITSPWAIMPEKLLEIQAIYASHVRGEKIDIPAIEARIGKPLINQDQGYHVQSGVAVIPISGVMCKKMNMLSQISGGASTQLIERDIKAALNDSSVNSILLHIDSPGGAVDGTQNLADVVKMAGTQKPVVAFADGVMASAAYWVGSAASEIVASSSTTQIGSIGVVTSHTDTSKAQESSGIKTTEISAGKYKRIASQNAPLSEEGAAMLQEQVDQLYTIFVDAVAENRGVDTETVLEDMPDGRVFLSKQAKKRGMIDHIANLETTIFNMSTGVWPMTKEVKPAPESAPVAEMSIETIKKDFPEIAAQLHAEGAKAECDRIKSCEEAALPGHEAIINAMKLDGKSTGADVALAIIAEEKKLRASHLQDFGGNAPSPIPFAAVPAVEVAVADDHNLPLDVRAQAKWDSDESVRKEFGTLGAYVGFMKVEQASKH